MALFRTDSIVMCCSNVEVARRWWIDCFDCKQTKAPEDWDDPLPSDVALKLGGDDQPRILLSDRSEVQQAGLTRSLETVPVVFCSKVKKAHEYLLSRGAAPGPIQDGGDTQFFEVRDPEGHVIEVCEEP